MESKPTPNEDAPSTSSNSTNAFPLPDAGRTLNPQESRDVENMLHAVQEMLGYDNEGVVRFYDERIANGILVEKLMSLGDFSGDLSKVAETSMMSNSQLAFRSRIEQQSGWSPPEPKPSDSVENHFGLVSSIDKIQPSENEEEFTSKFVEKFIPVKVLGQGTFGCVFQAEEIVAGSVNWPCAVKRIALKRNEGIVNNALREVDAMTKLYHTGVVSLLNAWSESPPEGWQREADYKLLEKVNFNGPLVYKDDSVFLYIQMQLGKTSLADWLASHEHRNLRRMKYWFWQIVSAVEYIHEQKFIHRDLKPSNIIFATRNHLKICDLGIVTDRVISTDGANNDQEVATERTFDQCTEMYMAPEQKGWVEYSSKVDIFALGLILAELCATMTTEQKTDANKYAFIEQVFDDYRNGKHNNALEHIPEVKKIVEWLARKNEIERPECDQILRHMVAENRVFESEFLQKFEPKRIVVRDEHLVTFEALNLMDQSVYAVKRVAVEKRWTNMEEVQESNRRRASLKHEGLVRCISWWIEKPLNGWQKRSDASLFSRLGYDDTFADSTPYIFGQSRVAYSYTQMEHCKHTLWEFLHANAERDLNRAKVWFTQLVSAVGYLQRNGVHSDLKTTAIFIENDCLKIECIYHRRLRLLEPYSESKSKEEIKSLAIILIELKLIKKTQTRISGLSS